MIKLEIMDIDNYVYKLIDENGNEYDFNLEFLDIEESPKIGDYIYVNSKLIDPSYEGYGTSYTFGSLKNNYGKNDILIEDIDVIKVVIGKLEIYLKRLYG